MLDLKFCLFHCLNKNREFETKLKLIMTGNSCIPENVKEETHGCLIKSRYPETTTVCEEIAKLMFKNLTHVLARMKTLNFVEADLFGAVKDLSEKLNLLIECVTNSMDQLKHFNLEIEKNQIHSKLVEMEPLNALPLPDIAFPFPDTRSIFFLTRELTETYSTKIYAELRLYQQLIVEMSKLQIA